MTYIVKTANVETGHYAVPKRGSAKQLTNGEWVYVWADYSRPGFADGKLAARGRLVRHQYDGDRVSFEISEIAAAKSIVRTVDLDIHKGSTDPVWGEIAKVRSNTNHRIFAIETPEAEAYLASLFC